MFLKRSQRQLKRDCPGPKVFFLYDIRPGPGNRSAQKLREKRDVGQLKPTLQTLKRKQDIIQDRLREAEDRATRPAEDD